MNDKELNQLLQKAIKDEDYERASKIRDELNRRQGNWYRSLRIQIL